MISSRTSTLRDTSCPRHSKTRKLIWIFLLSGFIHLNEHFVCVWGACRGSVLENGSQRGFRPTDYFTLLIQECTHCWPGCVFVWLRHPDSVCQEVHQEFVLEIEMLLLLVWYRHCSWMDWNHPGSDLHHPGFFLKKERWLALLFLSFLSPFEGQGRILWNSLIYITVVCIPHKNSGLQLCYLLNTIVITCILWTRFLTQVIIPSFFSCLIFKSSVRGSWFGWSQTHNKNCCGTIACVLVLARVLLFGSSLHDLLRVLLLLPTNRSFSFLSYFLHDHKEVTQTQERMKMRILMNSGDTSCLLIPGWIFHCSGLRVT